MVGSKCVTVFIADDDTMFRRMVSFLLKKDTTVCVFEYNTASELLQTLHICPQIIILDYNLPDASGLDVLKKIRQQSPASIVIFISGEEEPSIWEAAIQQGAFDFIPKNKTTRFRLLRSVDHAKTIVSLQNHP